MENTSDSIALVDELITHMTAKDAGKFVTLLTEDATFHVGNNPAIHGRDNIRKFCTTFFDRVSSMKHEVLSVENTPTSICWKGIDTYHRSDGSTERFPHCNVLLMEGGKVKEFLLYANNSAYYSPSMRSL
mmetsp:Transcript_106/g.240  ORF Transcript_106/g.240 Transcript_106/m.240 type:complete len:130 (-) Transcript_106:119-508(-)